MGEQGAEARRGRRSLADAKLSERETSLEGSHFTREMPCFPPCPWGDTSSSEQFCFALGFVVVERKRHSELSGAWTLPCKDGGRDAFPAGKARRLAVSSRHHPGKEPLQPCPARIPVFHVPEPSRLERVSRDAIPREGFS